jgi:hypothetical protein
LNSTDFIMTLALVIQYWIQLLVISSLTSDSRKLIDVPFTNLLNRTILVKPSVHQNMAAAACSGISTVSLHTQYIM